MRPKLILLSLLVPITLMIAAAAMLAWLFETEAGLQWAYTRLRAHVPGAMEIATLQGKLAGPISARGLSYRNEILDVHVDQARLDWSPTAILLGRLQVDAFVADGIHIAVNASESVGGLRANRFALPLNVTLTDVRLDHIQIERRGQTPYLVHFVELAGSLSEQVVRVDHLRIDAQSFGVDASGTLGLRRDTTEPPIRVKWHVEPPGRFSLKGSGEIAGNLMRLTFKQRLTEPLSASVHGEIHQPLAELSWRASARIPEFATSQLGLTQQPVRASVSVDVHGGRTRFDATGTLQAQASDLPQLVGNFALHGATSGDELILDRLALRLPESGTQLTGHALWRPREATWNATAQWTQLRWPLTGRATLVSPRGTLEANGTYERYRLQLDFATTAGGLPARWRATGSGDRNGLAFHDIFVAASGATLQGMANVAWSPQLQWQATLNGRGINPAALWPDWPGALALQANLSGNAEEQRIHIETLRGVLRGQPFRAGASVTRRSADYLDISVEVAAGNANATVAGSIARRWSLSWQLAVPDLAAVVPHAAGHLVGNGKITGPRALPRIEARLSADNLAYETARLREAKIEATVDLSDAEPSRAAVSATDGALFDHTFERIAVTLDGHRTDHTVAVDVSFAGAMMQTVLHGRYANQTWSGSIQTSTVRVGGQNWSLSGRPQLVVARQRITLQQSCWRADSAQACIGLQRAEDNTALSLAARQLPLALFTPLLANMPDWHGTVGGDATLHFTADRLSQAHARWDFSAGDITLAGVTRTTLSYDGATGQLVVNDAGLRANAQVVLPGGDGGSAELALPQFHSAVPIERQPIDGRLTFAMHDLTRLAPLLPQLDELSGSLEMKFTVAGTLTDPRLHGQAALKNAGARISVTGIRVHDANLAVTAAGGDELRVNGEAQSGPGRLELSGRVTFPPDSAWRAQLRIVGDQFHGVDLRETQVFVSPDLHATLTPGAINVNGNIRLPKASWVLRSQKSDVVTTSPDIVVVSAPAGTPTPESRWKVTAQIRLILGDAVTFSGFGLNAKVAGNVALTETPTQATTARGEIRVVTGQYQAYGHKLTVERGRLVFVGGPVTNPGIDARASRKIDQITAGVEVKGSLQSPQLTLFSNPTMSQADTLSYLLFGRPLQSASAAEGRSLVAATHALNLAGGERLAQRIGSRFGIEDIGIESIETGTAKEEAAALVLGKQLSPRLYINYSIGLFTPANVLHLKYKLGKRWSLEAQSGARAGGDLTYTIER